MMKSLFRNIYYILPIKWRYAARRFFYLHQDLFFKKKYHDLRVPPKGKVFTGGGNFIGKAESFFRIFLKYTGIQPDHQVLEIGCGLGRMAYPLTQYLDPDRGGHYNGFDIVEKAIRWCAQEIHSKYPHFEFAHLTLVNDLYQSEGQDASMIQLPYQQSTFDRIYATSVFTHLLPDELENYIKESARIIKPGGILLLTFFIVKDNFRPTKFQFPYDYGNYLLMNKRVQRANVAYRIEYLQQVFQLNQLQIEKLNVGSWQGGSDPWDFQDIIILKKN